MPRALVTWRHRLANLIVRLWVVMPRRARLWAFLNDELPDSSSKPDDADLNPLVLPEPQTQADRTSLRDRVQDWWHGVKLDKRWRLG